MPLGSRPLACLLVVWVGVACSGGVDEPATEDASGTAGRLSVGTAGTSARGGTGGAPAGGGGAATAGTVAEAGEAAGGEPSVTATAMLTGLSGGALAGSVTFVQRGNAVELTLSLSGCPEGLHGVHLHENPSCADAGNAAGGHWSPQGELIPDLTCSADGVGTLAFSPAAGVWSVGGPRETNLLGHAVIVHASPSGPDAGARLACGTPAKVE